MTVAIPNQRRYNLIYSMPSLAVFDCTLAEAWFIFG